MMGQQPSSSSRSSRSHSLNRGYSIRESLQQKLSRSKYKNYSATFNYQDVDINWDLLNINTATEEELMTLSGVNRTVAHNIVEYRQDIGGFKKVEDIALVSGVGASKLELFRPEITVTHRRKLNNNNSFLTYASRCSSRNQSLESLPTSDSSSKISTTRLAGKSVNVNSANVFQLMAVRNVNQELAANVIDYRERKGNFNLISDLLKVKGMTPAKLSSIRANFYIDRGIELNGRVSNSFSIGSSTVKNAATTPKRRRSRSSASLKGSPKDTIAGGNDILLQEVYSLLLRHNNRPIVEDFFYHSRNDKPAFRMASWNLESFSTEKSKNPGVLEVICHTLLENGLSLIVVHELFSQEALNSIVNELNDPTLPTMKCWENNHGTWSMSVPEINLNLKQSGNKQLLSGFLYETSHGLSVKNTQLLDFPGSNFTTNKPLIGWFRLNHLEFMVVSCYLTDPSKSQAQIIASYIKKTFPNETNILMLEILSQSSAKEGLKPAECENYCEISPKTNTYLTEKIQCSRIWISDSFEKLSTGLCDVVREGLHHLAIPNGWTWGGAVSHSCPLWVEFYSNPPTTVSNGLIMNANGITTRSTPFKPIS